MAASKPFSFIVGRGGREFTIHSAIVASLSEALEKLVNGPFLESAAETVNWGHLDEDTFTYFWQYAYTRDYQFKAERMLPGANADKGLKSFTFGAATAASATDSPAVGGGPGNDTTTEINKGSFWESHPYLTKSAKKKKDKTEPPPKLELLWWRFIKLVSPPDIAAPFSPSSLSAAQGTEEGCLVCHAKVYAFADCYGIIKLRALSYKKLHGCLVHMHETGSPLAQFVKLAHFCYEFLVPDSLKQLIVHFATCEVERLWKDKQFQDSLEDYGAFSKDIIGSLRSRLE